MFETVEERIDFFVRHFPGKANMRVTVQMLNDMGFFTAPASTKYHGAYEGGLFDHSRNVMEALDFLTSRCGLKWSRPESPFIVGWFHDLCKCDQYRIDNSVPYTVGEPTRYEYNTNTLLKGHGEKSVMLAATLTDLTIEEVMCIRYHMGAFVPKEEWNDYTGAIHRFDNVLWTHTADMMAAHIREVDR